MPWYFPWSESIKKRACRYLLQHYLGDFLKEKLTLEQLTVDLYNGKGTVTDVPLDVWALNEMLENVGIPLEIIDGFISSISVAVPWTSLLNESCQIEVNGMELTFSPKHKADPWSPANMFDSTISWNSMNMTTSIQLAQQCLNQGRSAGEEQAESTQMFEGLEAFAQTIESVLSRIKLSFNNTIIRLEHIPASGNSGIGLELHIDKIDYSDLSYEELCGESNSPHSVYEPVAIAIKNFQIIGLRLYLDEFPYEKRTKLKESEERSSYEEASHLNATFGEGLGRLLVDNQMREGPSLMPQVQILGSHGKQSIKLKFKQNDSLAGPKIDVDYFFGAVNVFLTPRQVHLVADVVSSISLSTASSPSEAKDHHKKSTAREMRTEDYRKAEHVLQENIGAVAHNKKLGNNPDSWQSALDGFSPAQNLANRRGSHCSTDEEEFYSMSDYNSLPPLGQPPKLNVNAHGRLAGEPTGFSPERSLSNISLGGSSSLLSAMESPPRGSLAEQATNVFKATAPQPASSTKGSNVAHVIRSPHAHASSGLGGISTLDDPADQTHIKLRSSNIIIVLLHQEPLDTPKFEKNSRIISSEHTLSEISEEFFKGIGVFSMQSLFGESGDDTRKELSSYCPYDHLRCLVSAFTSTCESRTISGSKSICADFVIGKLMLDENLYDKTKKRTFSSVPYSQTKLLYFPFDQTMSAYPSGFGAAPAPCVKIKIQKTERGRCSTVQSRATIIPRSLVNIQVSKVEIELDVSIVDRIAAVLNPGPLYQTANNGAHSQMHSSFLPGSLLNQQTAFNQAIEDSSLHSDSKTDISLNCPKINILLRFPVPDLRPASDIDKRSWWQKATRSESIRINVQSLEFKTMLSHMQSSYSFELRFKEATGFFETSKDEDVEFLHIGCIENENDSEEMHLDWPRIVISEKPITTRSVFEDAEKNNSSPDSQFDSLEETFPWVKSEPSPFSSNPAMFEKEELVMPGCIAEMNAFQDLASATSSFCISCHFPDLKLNLQDKESFSLIYNRLFNDLMMWEPSAPAPVETAPRSYPPPQGSIHVNLTSQVGWPGNDRFFPCRGAVKDAYDSDSDQDLSMTSTMPDDNPPQNQWILPSQQSNMAFSIHVDRGKVAFFPPMKIESKENLDGAENDSKPRFGHVVIEADSLNFFIVSAFKGDANLDYMQLYSTAATLYHSSHMEAGLEITSMEDAFCIDHLNKTIYRSDKGVLLQSQEASGVGSETVSTLSLAIKTKRFPTKNRQDNLVAVGLRGCTLRHLVYGEGESWLSQIMNFMSVEDDAVLGFTFPTVLTTLYLHLWGCCVDYRPKFLSLHSMLMVEAFSLSSNISPGSSESVLRFIINDSTFYLSNKQHQVVDLDKDFICVMDMGLFELILRLSDGHDKKRPLLDLSMSNNILNIRTCSDSCSALIKLIKYFANDGDLECDYPECSSGQSSQNESTENLYSRSSVDENALDSLMADAMLEDGPSNQADGTEIKMFTDRHGFTSSELFSSSGPSTSSSMRSLQGTLTDDDNDDDNDFVDSSFSSGDEYCILEPEKDDQSLEDIEPSFGKLVNEAIVIVDNHFKAPRGRYDQLSAPAGYPTPSYRYTLREMSLVWQMFGGSDFKSSDQERSSPVLSSSPKNPVFSPHKTSKQTSKQNSVQNRKKQALYKKYETRKKENESPSRKRKNKGGPKRDNDVLMELHMNKIRFQHEIYPEEVDKISRDVLIIYDLEIRDRLAVSQINKFLYRFSSESLPLKSSANMFTLKMLLTKPEDGVKNKEGSIRVSAQPLRLNIDQDSLFFLKSFFSEISEDDASQFSNQASEAVTARKNRTRHSSTPGTTGIHDELNIEEDHFAVNASAALNAQPKETLSQEDSGIFYRSVVFSPEVPIRLDYHGKSFNLEQGTLTGLLIGLAQLNCSELTLKRLCCRSGLLGGDKLLSYLINEWLVDIRRNQIPGILGGVGPTYSFVQLYQGIKDLFWLPIQQYKQDGRLVRGLQKGAHSFSTSTAMAILELTNRLVQTVQVAAETAYDVVSPGVSATVGNLKPHYLSSKTEQPADLREGVTNAYNVLSEGISQTATTIMKVAVEEHEKKGVTGAVGGVLRQIPPSVMQPLILASEATSNVLGGARNQLSPHARIEASKKWKSIPK